MKVQVLPDGADYESSIPYHRLVAELFLGAARLADCQGAPLSPALSRSRYATWSAYLAAVTRPDGLMPQVGDADDGRLHVFDGYGTTSPQDGRASVRSRVGHVRRAGVGRACRRRRRVGGGVVGSRRAAVAARGRAARSAGELFPQTPASPSMRSAAGHYLLVTNGVVGTNGFGNHKHNDQLSFEYHHGGVPLIVDPGSYVYTSDADARNRFRGTAFHNTVCVDGVEQNELRPDWLFRLFETSQRRARLVRGSRRLRSNTSAVITATSGCRSP